MNRSRFSITATIIAACLFLAVLPVCAVSITQSPTTISRGGQVSIGISDLKDGSTFSILIDGEFVTAPGARFNFQTTGFSMPFSLFDGRVSATTHGTTMTSFSAQQGGTTVSNVNSADADGYYSFSQSHDVSSGTYNYLKLEGQARGDVSTLTTSMNLMGTKKGPDNSQITFSVDGIDNGLVRLTVLVDGKTALPTRTITVGSGLSTRTTTTTAVPTSTTTTATATLTTTTKTTTTTTGTTTTSATGTQATSSTTAATTGTTTTTGTVTATTSPAGAALARTFTSPDQKVTLATKGTDYAGFLVVKGTAIPRDWLAVSDIYTLVPDTLVFNPAATLAFKIPKVAGADYAYFIGQWEDEEWTMLPSSATATTIEARISRAGTYGLMAYRPESTLPATSATTVAGTAATGTSLSTPTVKGTPRVASVAAAATTPPAATTLAAPGLIPWLAPDPLVVFGALAICCALVLRRD